MRDIVTKLTGREIIARYRITNRRNWKLNKAEIWIGGDRLSARDDVAKRDVAFADITRAYVSSRRVDSKLPGISYNGKHHRETITSRRHAFICNIRFDALLYVAR